MLTKRNKELFSAAESLANFGTFEFDVINQTLSCSSGIYTIFEWSHDDILPTINDLKNQLQPNKHNQIVSALITAIKAGKEFNDEISIITKNEKNRIIRCVASAKINDAGHVVKVSGVVQDITEIKEKEAALEASKTKLSKILNSSLDIICAVNNEGIYESVSSACKDILGYTPEEMVGKHFIDFVYKEDLYLTEQASATILSGISMTNFENRLVSKTGEIVPIIWSANWDESEKMMYCVARNATEIKIAAFEKILLSDISNLFLQFHNLQQLLNKTVRLILDTEDFCMGEIWLLSANKKSLSLVAVGHNSPQMKQFFEETNHINQISQNEGLPGIAWEQKKITYWDNLGENSHFIRREYAKKYGLDSLYTIPLINGTQVIGVLSLGISKQNKANSISNQLFNQLSQLLAAEIIRKQLEIQLNNIFNSSPDLIIIAGLDGYVKKANPAAKEILEYEISEIINLPFTQFIHPLDENITRQEAEKLARGVIIHYFENRLITKSGNIKWIAWTFTPSAEDNLIYGIGKDITEKKNLEEILTKSNKLAKIGSWEININKGRVYWSDITKEIREVEQDFIPSLEIGISKFKKGIHRDTIEKRVEDCINNGKSWDEELLLETFKGNWKWVRSIGEGEFLNGKCIRVYGSFQDINDKKKAQQEIIDSNERFSMVAKATNDLIWDWDIITGETIRLGKAFFENLGYKNDFNKTNKSIWLELIHPADLERVENNRNIIFNDPSETYWEDQYRCKRADGTYAIVYDRGYIVRTSNGKAIKMIGSTQDISSLKQNEIELAESKKRYSELFHLSPLPMWVYDIETLQFLDVNVAAQKHYGYTEEEFLEMTLADIRPIEDITQLEAEIEIAKANPKEFMSGVFSHAKKNGNIIIVEIQSKYIEYKGRNARVILANDITETLEYISTIESKNKELQHIAWLQSHVIRAPVAKIMGIIKLIQNVQLEDAEKKELLLNLILCAGELDKVIHDIADKTHAARLK